MTEEQRKEIIVEATKRFGQQQWFRFIVVHNSYPTTGEPMLEIMVNYLPLFERKAVMDFAQSVNLKEKFTIVDKDGRPAQ